MNKNYVPRMTLASCCVMGLALNGGVWAQTCAETNPVSVSGTVGGSGTCAEWGMFGCSVNDGIGSCQASADGQSFTVKSVYDQETGAYNWELTSTSEGFAGLDLAIWSGRRKGQNSPHIFAYDTLSTVGMDCGTEPNVIYFCSDGVNEFPPDQVNVGTPKVGTSCSEQGGSVADVFGVEIDVSMVNPAQGETTVVVARENRPCDGIDQPACGGIGVVTDDSDQKWEPDPSFGFIKDGQISLENICVAGVPVVADQQAVTSTPSVVFVERPQCDPDKNVINGQNTDNLAECSNRIDGIVREEVGVGFEGSGYVRGGGTRRYY